MTILLKMAPLQGFLVKLAATTQATQQPTSLMSNGHATLDMLLQKEMTEDEINSIGFVSKTSIDYKNINTCSSFIYTFVSVKFCNEARHDVVVPIMLSRALIQACEPDPSVLFIIIHTIETRMADGSGSSPHIPVLHAVS